jgi:putative transposase
VYEELGGVSFVKQKQQKGYAMNDNNIIEFKKPDTIKDHLTDVLREGARQMLAHAVEAEVEAFLECYKELTTAEGQKRIVRNGHLPERTIQTGVGHLPVKVPRTRDRGSDGIRFSSSLLPPYLKRTKSIEALLPWLYLKGISTNDFPEALQSLFGESSKGLSSGTICRIKEKWAIELESFHSKDLSKKRYAYWYTDGVYFSARMSDKQCMLVIIGVEETGKKELVALQSGLRESELSWTELLIDLKERGLTTPPKLSVGDGALGFWKALHKVFDGKVQQQRCWFHKAGNILNKLPKTLQANANKALQQIWMAATKKDAEKSFEKFIQTYGEKYPKAAQCLRKDKDVLLTFYEYPAAHWPHLRTTNAIESVFATVKLRTAKTRGCLSHKTGELMAYQLIQSAAKRWIRLRKCDYTAEVIRGVNFKDGVRIIQDNQLRNAA